jgi:hypothetical protein
VGMREFQSGCRDRRRRGCWSDGRARIDDARAERGAGRSAIGWAAQPTRQTTTRMRWNSMAPGSTPRSHTWGRDQPLRGGNRNLSRCWKGPRQAVVSDGRVVDMSDDDVVRAVDALVAALPPVLPRRRGNWSPGAGSRSTRSRSTAGCRDPPGRWPAPLGLLGGADCILIAGVTAGHASCRIRAAATTNSESTPAAHCGSPRRSRDSPKRSDALPGHPPLQMSAGICHDAADTCADTSPTEFIRLG